MSSDSDISEEYFSNEEQEDTFDSKIRKKIRAKLNAKRNVNQGIMISEIHPEIITKYNSVEISYMNTHHLLIYVTKDGEENDRSWQTLKTLIELPIILVSESDAVRCVDELLTAKSLYYRIRNERIKNNIVDDQKYDLFNTLQVKNFEKAFLHTIILFDDISNSKLFSSEESYFSQLLRRCRHTNLTFYLLIQGWKGIKPHIKNEITTLYLFPGFNKQQVHYIYNQSASSLDFDDFYECYQKLGRMKRENPEEHPIMIVQVTDGGETYLRT